MTTDKLLQTLQTRFEDHMERHPDWSWDQVQARLQSQPDSLDILAQMEDSGGEPDFVDLGPDQDPRLIYVDLYTKTPKKRESLCYDEEARLGRKKFPPESSVQAEVAKTGSQLLDPDQYRALQKVEAIDLKSSVWIQTPDRIRELGGALFGDNRYDTIFIYHNGAESYYKGRGYRSYIALSDED